MSELAPLVLHGVEVEGDVVDVVVADGRIEAIGCGLAEPRHAEGIEGQGGALLPGLHDHHLHLLATAAVARSIDVSLLGPDAFVAALRGAHTTLPTGAWMRVIGYHESAVGPLDCRALDDIVRERPVRVQHATGAMWMLNSAAIRAVHLDREPADGVERDVTRRSDRSCFRPRRLAVPAPSARPPGRVRGRPATHAVRDQRRH